MKRLLTAYACLAMSFVLPSLSLAQNTSSFYERDIAIVLPHDLNTPVRLQGAGDAIFNRSWLSSVNQAFSATAVGNTLEIENRLSDWRLVTARLVPCSPLSKSVLADQDIFCWPEVRQVWQPVMEDFQGRTVRHPYFADDRAIHVLYDVTPTGSDAAVLKQMKNQLDSDPKGTSVPSELRQRFVTARNSVVTGFMQEILSLRDPSLSTSSLRGNGVRPELYDNATEDQFIQRLISFFGRNAPVREIKELTAFSLPEGREPAHIDEWIFVQFFGNSGRLVQQDIKIFDRTHGRELVSIGPSESSSMTRDDARIYDLIELNPALERTLRETVLLFETDRAALNAKIADRREVLVPNTSCASCHKFNGLNFNFHNFSYFEELDLEIAPRTRKDVELDLAWLVRWL